MKAFAIATILLLIGLHTYAQQNFVTWSENKLLQWDDFSGKAKDTSHFEAESFAEVIYSYSFHNFQDFNFDVKAIFNKNTSWIKNAYKSEALLKHEQVHFDIAELFARKLKLAFNNYIYSSNFQEEVVQVFNEVKAEYHSMQQQYDEETSHSTILAKQKKWETLVKEELEKVKQINITNGKDRLFVMNN